MNRIVECGRSGGVPAARALKNARSAAAPAPLPIVAALLLAVSLPM